MTDRVQSVRFRDIYKRWRPLSTEEPRLSIASNCHRSREAFASEVANRSSVGNNDGDDPWADG